MQNRIRLDDRLSRRQQVSNDRSSWDSPEVTGAIQPNTSATRNVRVVEPELHTNVSTVIQPTATLLHHPAKLWSEEPFYHLKKLEECARLFCLNGTELLVCVGLSLKSTGTLLVGGGKGQSNHFCVV
ncbi:hypothetical protein PR048_008630 [Dryococelus australis]|uniref:Uncharacterized protein n=1 Tax=Dryococelus australis TaxID=614101 RepID=A0ABQ9HXN2_9NEOP|nr:hypothetical protein PR048_008630 [Dryococelus australis]